MALAVLQESVPYDTSKKWEIHHNFFQLRGSAAWKQGEIPYYITCNTAAALQAVKMIFATVERMEKDKAMKSEDPIVVLEHASGVGLFCFNFIRMFKYWDEKQGKKYTPRLRYIFSDYSRKTATDGSTLAKLQEFVQEGLLSFAVVDALNPQAATSLDGKPLQLKQLTAIISNYMQCVLPLTILRKTSLGWREKYIGLRLEVPENENKDEYLRKAIENPVGFELLQRLVEDEEYLPLREGVIRDPMHIKVMDEMAKGLEKVTFPYPYGSIQNIERTLPLLREGGIMLHSDKGYANVAIWEGIRSCDPSLHGNSLAHSVNFPLLKNIFQTPESATMLSEDPDASIKTLLIEKRSSSALSELFRSVYIDECANYDLSDYFTASDALMQKDKEVALRFLHKTRRVAPGDAKVLYKIASQLLEEKKFEESIKLFKQCEEADLLGIYDCAFSEGRALYNLNRNQEAIDAYSRSMAIEDHPTTRTNIGLCYEALKQPEKAKECYERALVLRPDYERAKTLIAGLKL